MLVVRGGGVSKSEAINVRVGPRLLAKIDALRPALGARGENGDATRSQVIRYVLAAGVEALAKRWGVALGEET